MSCCFGCCKSADDLSTKGSNLLFPVDPYKFTLSKKEDVKALIVALKLLRKAADQNHAGACYLFGSTFGNCFRFPARLNCSFQVQSTLVKAFKSALPEPEFNYSLLNRVGQEQNAVFFYRDIAMKYLCKAARLGNQDATAEIQAIETYDKQLQDRAIENTVAKMMKTSKQSGQTMAVMTSYQTF